MANARRAVGEDRAVAPGAEGASARRAQSAGARPRGDGGDSLRAPHWVSVECAERDRALLVVLGASPLSGMDHGGGVLHVVAAGAAALRSRGRARLAGGGGGWRAGRGGP